MCCCLKKILFISFVVSCLFAKGQPIQYGYSVGVSFSFGTHVNRLGISLGGYFNYDFAQVNIAAKGYYDFQSYALKQKTPEIQLGIGGLVGIGRTDTIRNSFIGLTENNTSHNCAVGYSFLQYWDGQQTSQSTGILTVNAQNISVLIQNDLFGNFIQQKDRFRTGAFALEYQYNTTKIGLSSLLWTHDYAHCTIVRTEKTTKWSRFGYYHDENVKNRTASLGILSVYGRQWLPFNQELRMDVGVNSERVRNFFQNKLIHDQPMLPDKLIWRKPPHVPMITIKNEQYLYRDAQTIRPLEFYFNLSANGLPFF